MNELEFITTPDNWPQWPICPVVSRRDRWNDPAGFVIAGEPPIVYLANIYSMPSGPLSETTKGLEKKEYQDWNSLLAEWRVD